MAFFDKLGDLAKNLTEKTNDAIETTKLNSRAEAERRAAGEELKKAGEYYYGRYAAGETMEPEVLPYFEAALGHYELAAAAQAEIDRIKAEKEAARAEEVAREAEAARAAQMAAGMSGTPGMGAPGAGMSGTPGMGAPGTGMPGVPAMGAPGAGVPGAAGMGTAGVQTAPGTENGIRCGSCGAVNPADKKFCCECGSRLEEPVPSEIKCPSCGAVLPPGTKFCGVCGTKLA